MDILRALLLGVIQALTEFLPISSSAHLILFRDWLGFESVDGLTFDVALHIGTIIAVMAYFHRDLGRLVAGLASNVRYRRDDFEGRLAWYIALSTIPAAVAGVAFGDAIENVFRRPSVIVVTLSVGGALFLVAERLTHRTKVLQDVTLGTSLLIGVAQSLALVPGVSRSGITMIAGMSRGLQRAEAARFSFLLSVPIMLGAGLKKALDLPNLALGAEQFAVLSAGVLSSAIVGWFVIKYLLRFLQRNRLDLFAYYRFVLAAAIVLWLIL